ncbi:MAG: (2Fe-2S)-binding protein [Christensenellaceae bacterium]|jgi:carbon-monoxide dehydrogenase small subunit|nr:(2Fe-2S)-binding protein [Christensenellaceae bacterium]
MLLHIILNGKPITAEIEPEQTLLSVLRNDLKHTGAKQGCGVGECGACTVVLDGRAIKSCTVLAAQCEGSEVLTIEGLAKNNELHPLQRAFIDHGAIQCGYCTAGFIMTALALLQRKPNATRGEIQAAISGNLCRCTGYVQIIDAIEAYAAALGEPPAKEGL